MLSIPANTVAARECKRRLFYTAEQLASDKPHTIAPRIFRYAPGMGPDGEYIEGRQWPDEQIDIMVDMRTYARLSARVPHVE